MSDDIAVASLRLKPFWVALGWAGIGAVFWFSLTVSPPNLGFAFGDKVGHFLGYVLLTGWFGQLYRTPAARRRLVVGFVAMGAGLEVLQWSGGVRHFELADMAANTAGVLTAWALLRAGFTGALLRVESLFFGRTS